MATLSVPSEPDALKLIRALELFIKRFGSPKSELELQATIGALATVIDLKSNNLTALIHQVASYYQQTQRLEESVEETTDQVSVATIQRAKERLFETKETLTLLIRTYLQRVSSRLSAKEFVDLVQIAIVLLDKEQPESGLSLPERKRLLYIALKTFGNKLSQPIPALGKSLPKAITKLLAELIECQRVIGTNIMETTLQTLITQTQGDRKKLWSHSVIRTAFLENGNAIAPLHKQDTLDTLTNVLLFKLQLQTPSAEVIKSEQAIAAQVNQAISDFKANYQPLTDITQSQWDNELSISSALFTSDNFETANTETTWLPGNTKNRTSKDETLS